MDALNPNFRGRAKSFKLPSIKELEKGILAQDRGLISRALTLCESKLAAHRRMAEELLQRLMPYTGGSIRIGITGVPGVGKSTFIEAFGKHLIDNGKKLAVLAIDPSSGRNRGSILGDKTRMHDLSQDKRAFIRPSPSSGSLGGVARRTRESILICEAAGFDIVIVETVGVGQSETTVRNMVDFFMLLMLAGAGDELQGIKRGIMEMAD
ncbi:MAG: methylmalonyl Co-A mutase-associated GTPase MeaB, partial [Croceimicrobium sp.]